MEEQAVHRALMRKEIDRIVANALRADAILDTSRHAAELYAAYPGTGWSIRRIIDELIIVAALSNVRVETSRPPHPEAS